MITSARVMLGILLFFCLTACKSRNEKKVVPAQQALDSYLNKAEYTASLPSQRLKYLLMADSVARAIEHSSEQVKCARLIANLYLSMDSTEQAYAYLLKAIELAKNISEQDEIGVALNSIGAIYMASSKYDRALTLFDSSVSIFTRTHNRKYLGQTMVNMGTVLKNEGRFQEAFKVTLNAVRILESEKDTSDLAAPYSTLGNILKELNKLDDALQYHESALLMLRAGRDTANMPQVLNNIGNVFRYKKEYNKALNYYFQALDISKKLNRLKIQATVADNIGQVYAELTDYASSEKFFHDALAVRTATKDLDGCLTTANRLSRLYLRENKIEKAKTTALNALSASPRSGLLKQRHENYLTLFEIYEISGKYKQASEYARKTMELNDSLFTADLAAGISQMKVRYETEKKELENASLRKDKLIAASVLATQKSQKLVWIILTISITVIGSGWFYSWRRRKNDAFERELTGVKQETLNAQMSDHFISNAMDSINNFIETNENSKASEYLLLFHRLIREVLENSFRRLITLEDELLVVGMYIELEKLRFPAGALQYILTVEESIDTGQTYIPPMIFQVLVENAIRHGFEKNKGGTLKIQVTKAGPGIRCVVEDNGIGRHASAQMTVKQHTGRTSLGLSLAEKLILTSSRHKEKGQYKITDLVSVDNRPVGTHIELTIPNINYE